MTGAISAASHALQKIAPGASAIWVPCVFAGCWAIVSLLMSIEGLKKGGKHDAGTIGAAFLVCVSNALVLAGAVVGTDVAVS